MDHARLWMKTKRPTSRSYPARDGVRNKRTQKQSSLQPSFFITAPRARTHLNTEEKRISHVFSAEVNPCRVSGGRQQAAVSSAEWSRSGVSEGGA